MDISENMLRRDWEKIKEASVGTGDSQSRAMETVRIVASEDKIPLKDKSIDVVLSNLALHWVNDLPGALSEFHRVLREDGVFIGCMFGEKTLQELRSAFVLAETEREGGVSPHTSPFANPSELGSLLTSAGFTLTTVDQEIVTQDYKDAFVLMRDLRGMGESNAGLQRRPFTPLSTMMSAASIYQGMYGNEDGTVPASFQVIWMIGWRQSSTQPKPLARGSQEYSLKDVNKL